MTTPWELLILAKHCLWNFAFQQIRLIDHSKGNHNFCPTLSSQLDMCVFSHVTLFMHKPEEIEILQDAVDFVSFLDQYSPFVMFAAVTA